MCGSDPEAPAMHTRLGVALAILLATIACGLFVSAQDDDVLKTSRLEMNSLVEYDLAKCGDGSTAAYFTQKTATKEPRQALFLCIQHELCNILGGRI